MGFNIPTPDEPDAEGSGSGQASDVTFDGSGLVIVTGVEDVQTALELVDAALDERLTAAEANASYAPLSFSGASLTKSGTQSVGATSEVAVTFDGEGFDTDNYHESVTNPTRLTIPTDGYYRFNGSGRVDGLADAKQIRVRFIANGVTQLPGANQIRSNATTSLIASHTCTALMTAGQWVEMWVFNGDSASRNIQVSPDTSFQVQRIGT